MGHVAVTSQKVTESDETKAKSVGTGTVMRSTDHRMHSRLTVGEKSGAQGSGLYLKGCRASDDCRDRSKSKTSTDRSKQVKPLVRKTDIYGVIDINLASAMRWKCSGEFRLVS
jgi:hypothetical protein